MKKSKLPSEFDGILWTAVRDMMLDIDPNTARVHIDVIQRIAHLLNEKQRKHMAWDIRQNIEWNTDMYEAKYETAATLWNMLAIWLEDTETKHSRPASRPGKLLSLPWFSLVYHSLGYICHRHSYAVSYADDIATLIPRLRDEQYATLMDWAKNNVKDTDDRPVRKLAAALDLDNRYIVHARATAEQMRQWAKDHNAIDIGVGYNDIDDMVECFLFDGEYIGLDRYVKRPYSAGGVIPDFIVEVTPWKPRPQGTSSPITYDFLRDKLKKQNP